MSFANVGRVWTPDSLGAYLKQLSRPLWVKGICLHHTAFPDLSMRPRGFTAQHIINIEHGYKNDRKWSAGPHFFIDEDQIWGMTPPTIPGIHAVSFNSSTIGIEVLGDYDKENPLAGRGLECWNTTFAAVKALMHWLDLPMNEHTIKFHRDDPKTNKSCPGTKVTKDWVLENLNVAQKKCRCKT